MVLLMTAALVKPLVGQTPVNNPTWRYDTTHAGANTQETLLTPSNVTPTTFGKLFSRAVDGYVYAQPLYISGLTMGDGLVHNVLFVATQHDSIYAFDADSNGGTNAQPLWQISLLNAAYGAAAGATTVPSTDLGTSDIVPEIGITGTPAINAATNTMYVVGKTKESGGYVQRLHAINILTGAEQANSPTVIQGTVPGTGQGSSGGSLPFSSLWEMNRGALNYYNGYVYVSFGAHGDNGPWHGWVFGFNATTMAQTGLICLSPSGYGNGIWAAGAGLPIDNGGTAGRMFLSTGNGTYSAYPPFNNAVNYGDSIVALSLANGALTPTDAFTPFNQATLSSSDADQGSGGVLMLPDQQGANPHILIQIGKEGRILVLNRDNLGGYAPGGSSNTNALQDILGQTKGLWSAPAYWNGNVYVWGTSDYAKSFPINSGVLNTNYSSESTAYSAFPGPSFVVSSNGTQHGIAWAATTALYQSNGSEILYAFDATNLATTLWESDTNDARDDAGPANKFTVPVVTNGKVYLGAAYQVDVYGLLNGAPIAAAPAISPNGGTFGATQAVKLTSTTPSASIYYTLDGSVPTTAANLYTGPVSIGTNTVVRAIASATGFIQSPISSATFTFMTQTPTPSISPAGGTYSTPQNVTLTDSDSSATIYYTLDGTTPTASSKKYTAPFTVSAASTIVNAVAIDPALPNVSTVVSATYAIQAGATTINFGNGFSSVVGLTLNGSTIASDDSRLQLTDGGDFEAGSVFYNTPINVQAFTTDFSFQLSSAVADGFTFTIQNTGLTALGANGGSLGYAGIGQSVAVKFDFYNNNGEGSDSTGVYVNGALPETPAVDMTSSGLELNSGDSIQAHVTYDGTTLIMKLTDVVSNKTFTLSQAINIPQTVGANTAFVGFTGGTGGGSASQKILAWTYSTQAPASVTATPTFSPAGGSFTTAQNVTLASTTSGAAIYYTTNGTTPTAASAKYTAPIAVGNGTTTIEALAIANSVSSTVSSATYVVTQTATPPPTFSPAAGTYSSAQNVTLGDSASGAIIYYTTNGTTPTTSSAVYSTPISVSASETVQAVAIASGSQLSTVSSAAYTIQTTTPNINFASFSNATGLTFNGISVLNGAALQLSSSSQGYQAGSAWYATPVNIAAFTTDFNFQLVNAVADGMTFTIQGQSPSAIGPSGGGLGYGAAYPGGPVGITNSIAVKFDLYNNNGEGSDSTGFYTNGVSPTTPAIDMTASGVNPAIGDVMHAHLTYDGTTLVLLLTDTTTSASFTTSTAVNIPTLVGSSTAYVGFTAGVGGYSATQNILNWTFTSGTSTTPVTAAPTFTPAAGSYTTAQSVTIADSTTGAVIYYTTNGTTPTTSSAVYSGAIAVGSGTTTIEALALAPNYSQSTVTTGTYKVTAVTATPSFTPAAGSYTTAQSVTIADSTTGAVIYYTTNGTTPTTTSAVYSGAIAVGTGSTTIEALAVAPNYSQSAVKTGVYKVTAVTATPSFTPAAGSYTTAQSVTIADSTTGAVIYYTTNGTTPTTSSAVYSGAITVGAGSTTIEALAVAPNYSQSAVKTGVYKVTPVTAAPVFTPAAGSYAAAQSVTIADATTGAVVYYTTNGTTPTTSSAVYSGSGAISVGSGTTTVEALALATNYSQSVVTTATYKVTSPVTAAPVFAPAGGSYTVAQSVTITDSTSGAVIHYTMNGTTPTTSSSVYSGAIAVGGGSTTVEALAVAPGDTQSTVTSATYSVTLGATPPPTFSPAAGTYSSAQKVALADSASGAIIYYTTNGTTPTTSSTVYSTPISVSASETVQAVAIVSGSQLSTVSSAAYTIQTTTPNINFASFSNATGLTFNGISVLNGAALQLSSSSQGYQAGSAWYATPVNIAAFTTDFNFQLVNAVADGMTFTIQGQGPSAIGPSGGGLGYGAAYPGGPVGITNSIAVKFDLYNNNGEGSDSTGFYTNGVSPTTPAIDMTASGVNPAIGDVMHAHLTYDGTTLVLLLTDTTTSASFTTSTAVNIPTLVGSSTAYVGFTAGVGGYSATQNILNWTFTSTTTQAKVGAQIEAQPGALEAFLSRPVHAGEAIVLPASWSHRGRSAYLVKDYEDAPAPRDLRGEAVKADAAPALLPAADPLARTAGEPYFRPHPGKLSGSTNIQLKSQTPNAVIHYTMDGAQPTNHSPVYRAPIAISGTALTIKAFAKAAGKKDSPVVTGMYRIGD